MRRRADLFRRFRASGRLVSLLARGAAWPASREWLAGRGHADARGLRERRRPGVGLRLELLYYRTSTPVFIDADT